MINDLRIKNWCTCDLKGNCFGCLIEQLIKNHYGEKGIEYLREFIKKKSERC